MTVGWSARALSDAAAIYAYIAAHSEESAERVCGRLFAAAKALSNFPHLGRSGRIAGQRELVVDQYILRYKVLRNEVRILSVEHGGRR